MQQVGVDTIYAQVFQGRCERLGNLSRNGSSRIIGHAMILAWAKGEFGLQEEIISRDHAGFDRCSDGFTDCRLVIMSALVCRIDSAKSLLDGQRRK